MNQPAQHITYVITVFSKSAHQTVYLSYATKAQADAAMEALKAVTDPDKFELEMHEHLSNT